MNAYETYKDYLALKRHFSSDSYDYFRYNGKVTATAESFERRKDVKRFLKISQHNDPHNLLVSNFVMTDSSVSPHSISEEHFIKFLSMKLNATYNFKEDLKKFKPVLVENLVVDSSNSVPYIIELFTQDEISLSTLLIFEGIFSCNEKWKSKDEYLLIENISKKIAKSWQFLDVSIDKYKRAVKTVFNV